ncbi:unnamed protein product [Schistocephalus solidus]|uniref:Uncharacterized protein n=1 Tax=Schistocephalus solidus TaxID=70667 RepID=A0A183SQH2_SCHSO|nr:unnamed protein product [Schistocephalus solidus]
MNGYNAWRLWLPLRLAKCNFFVPSVKYLGFIIDQDGRNPDPDNIDTLKQMPPPKGVNYLRSFLGLRIHYSSFLPEMHHLRHPMKDERRQMDLVSRMSTNL